MFLINVFTENGHSITVLEKVIKEYMNNNTSIIKTIDTIKNDKIVKLSWAPKRGPKSSWTPKLGPKSRKEFKKIVIKTIFTSGRNLKNLIRKDKLKLLPNSFSGVYQFDCICNALYIDETKKKVINGKWESSGAIERCLECHGQLNWINPETLLTKQSH